MSQVTKQLDDRTQQVELLKTRLTTAQNELDTMAARLPSSESHKICVVFNDNWQDAVQVPDSWTRTTCQTAARYGWPGGTGYYLACIDKDGVEWGDKNGGVPKRNNCAWAG
jgi:hypothetical protein